MNRRHLLKAAPAAVVTGAAPAVAQAETAVATLFRKWTAAQARSDAASDDEFDAEHDHRWELE